MCHASRRKADFRGRPRRGGVAGVPEWVQVGALNSQEKTR